MDKTFWKLQELQEQYSEQKTDVISWSDPESGGLPSTYAHLYNFKNADEPPDDRDYFWQRSGPADTDE